jgi:hypothetical protein
MKVALCYLHALCVSVSVSPLSAFVWLKLDMYIMTPEPISTAYLINASYQSLCLYVYPPTLLGNRSVKTLPRQRTQTQ